MIIGAAVYFTSGGKPKPAAATESSTPVAPVKAAAAPKPKPPPVSTPPAKPALVVDQATSHGWIDGLAEWLAVPEYVSYGNLQQEGAVWRYVGPQAIMLGAKLTPPRIGANIAVRSMLKHTGKSSVAIHLRIQKGSGNFYMGTLGPDGKAEIKLSKERQQADLASGVPIPGFDPALSHTMEFRAEGEVLTLLVDGEARATANDRTYTAGGINLIGGLFEKIEYRDLGTAPAAPVVAGASGGGWSDGLAEYLAVPANASRGTFKAEADAWRYVGPGDLFLHTKKAEEAMANMAVRVTVREMGSYITVNLRQDDRTKTTYTFTVAKTGGAAIKLNDKTILEEFKFSPSGNASHFVFEARAEGDLLTVLVNGEKMGSVRDSTLTSGGFSVIPQGCLVEKIEYRELPALQAAAPPTGTKEAAATAPTAPAIPPATPPPAAPADPKLIALLQKLHQGDHEWSGSGRAR